MLQQCSLRIASLKGENPKVSGISRKQPAFDVGWGRDAVVCHANGGGGTAFRPSLVRAQRSSSRAKRSRSLSALQARRLFAKVVACEQLTD